MKYIRFKNIKRIRYIIVKHEERVEEQCVKQLKKHEEFFGNYGVNICITCEWKYKYVDKIWYKRIPLIWFYECYINCSVMDNEYCYEIYSLKNEEPIFLYKTWNISKINGPFAEKMYNLEFNIEEVDKEVERFKEMLVAEREFFYIVIRKKIIEWNPINLVEKQIQKGYDDVSKKIAIGCCNYNSMPEIIYDNFIKIYDESIFRKSVDECKEIARKIFEELNIYDVDL